MYLSLTFLKEFLRRVFAVKDIGEVDGSVADSSAGTLTATKGCEDHHVALRVLLEHHTVCVVEIDEAVTVSKEEMSANEQAFQHVIPFRR